MHQMLLALLLSAAHVSAPGMPVRASTAIALTDGQSEKILIYCNSNLDGTGICFNLADESPLTCTIAPGSVFPCTDRESTEWNCQYYGTSQFQCKRAPVVQNGVDPDRFPKRNVPVELFPQPPSGLSPNSDDATPFRATPSDIDSHEFQSPH